MRCWPSSTDPVVRADPANPNGVLIRPRLVGPTHVSTVLIPMAENDSETGRMTADLLDLVDPSTGDLRSGLAVDDVLARAARKAWKRRVLDVRARRDRALCRAAEIAALSPSFTQSGVPGVEPDQIALGAGSVLQRIVRSTGGIPTWFGPDLYEYQQLGALAAVAGRTLVADQPGAGKTYQALAAAAAVTERERRQPHHGSRRLGTDWPHPDCGSARGVDALGALDRRQSPGRT